jgi:hypothetical protein
MHKGFPIFLTDPFVHPIDKTGILSEIFCRIFDVFFIHDEWF